MAQWYTQLVFKDDTFLGDSLADWHIVDTRQPENLAGADTYTAVIVSGYSLYGQLQGYYSLGVAHILVDPASGKAFYPTEDSALHREPLETLTLAQKECIRDWLIGQYPTAWENSTEPFRRSLGGGQSL
jgi:hypothetical protein